MDEALSAIWTLWTAAFGEPPAIQASAEMLSEVLVRCLPTAPPYTDEGPPEL